MCCLFGAFNYSGQPIKDFSAITNALAAQATVRGTDATGIAYNKNDRLVIYKAPKSALNMLLKHPDNTVAVMGHTRHATQGNKKNNCNNHPFSGSCQNLQFALAHNGILSNDKSLQRQYNLPKTKIETDSYIAVQLLKYKNWLNADSLRFMAETVKGSFAFSVLDSNNALWLIRGDSPLFLVHFPNQKLYIYASTKEILYKALVDTNLFNEVTLGACKEIPVNPGDMLNIRADGTIIFDHFNYTEHSFFAPCAWWHYTTDLQDANATYIEDLKCVAQYYGYEPEAIDALLNDGFTLEEIEEYIYCLE